MTAIVGFTQNGNVYMTGDTLGSTDFYKEEFTESKVFTLKKFIFGYCGSFRFGEILEYEFVPPEHKKGIKDKAYLVQTFIPSLRETLEKCKYTKSDEKEGNGIFLMGYKGKLYKVQSDWSILESISNYSSIGSGDILCLGAMNILKDLDNLTPKQKVIKAIETASKHNPYVGGKITCKVLKKGD